MASCLDKPSTERVLEVTDLFWMEISIPVTVGDGDCEEVVVSASV